MTTITQDFSAVSDVSPYTGFSDGVEISRGTFRVSGGAISPSSYYNTAAIRMALAPSSGLMRIDFKAKNNDSMYGDDTAALFLNSIGTGYGFQLEGDRAYIRVFTAWEVTGNHGYATNPYTAGSDFFVTYDLDTNELKAYQVSVSSVEPVVEVTIDPENVIADLYPTIATNWYSAGAGGVIDFTFTATTTAITEIDSPFYPGITATLETDGLSEWASVSVGGVEVDFVDGVSLTMPAWTNGYEETLTPGETYTVVVTDIDDQTASIEVEYSQPVGYTRNKMGDGIAIDTGDQSIGKDPAIIDDVQVFPPALSGGAMSNAGTFTATPFGVYTGFWLRDLDNLMWQFGITLTDSTVVVDHTPDPFPFTKVSNATPNTEYISNKVTISGLGLDTDVSIVGWEYSKNDGAFVDVDTTANDGDTFEIKITTGANPKDSYNSTLTIGTRSETFTVSGPAASSGSGSDDAGSFVRRNLTR